MSTFNPERNHVTFEIEVPASAFIEPTSVEIPGGDSTEGYSIAVSGMGQLVGLDYTIPAHSSGNIKAKIQISALTSEDVKNLNELALGMLNASYHEQVSDEIKTSVSADLSLFGGFFGGGGKASFEQTHQSMSGKGLTEEQITKLMESFLERAKQMSNVELDFYINNTAYDYSVSGSLYLYTLSGTIKTQKETAQYRMLASQAAAGGPPPEGGGSPSTGNVVPLN